LAPLAISEVTYQNSYDSHSIVTRCRINDGTTKMAEIGPVLQRNKYSTLALNSQYGPPCNHKHEQHKYNTRGHRRISQSHTFTTLQNITSSSS